MSNTSEGPALKIDGTYDSLSAYPFPDSSGSLPSALPPKGSFSKSTSKSTPSGNTHRNDQPLDDAIVVSDAGETTPLLSSTLSLLPKALPESDSSSQVDHDPPFLNGISAARFQLIFAMVLLIFFLSCFDGTIMSSSHPVITSYFGSSNSASWMSTAFLLTSTMFQPLVGRLSDGVGRKVPFILTTFVFALGTLGCAIAPDLISFIVARAVCGVGAGGCLTLGSIIISDMVPISRRGVYQSLINMNYGIASALGAALGGWMADVLGWRWEFGIQVPPVLVIVVLMYIVIPDDIGRDNTGDTLMDVVRGFDWEGSFYLTISIVSFVLSFSLGGNIFPWSHPIVLLSMAIFIITFVLFLLAEARALRPIMPLRIITTKPHMNLIFSNTCAAVIVNAVWFNVPLYFQAVVLTSATESGMNLVAPIIVSSISGMITGVGVQITKSTKWPLVLGSCLLLIGTTMICFLDRSFSRLMSILILLPTSFGQGFHFPGTFMAILNENEQRDQAVVTSTLILWRSIGQVFGVASSSLVLQNALSFFLERNVQGPMRESIIELVRTNVEAVAHLEAPYLEQVIYSYDAALKMAFVMTAVAAAGSLVLVWPLELKPLRFREPTVCMRVSEEEV
ncbi:hypothetical protein TD95_005069 [Thielaviopsis punctulata]|uniref:Major facilitator superfamily (MFS) profile domain-containing protein n=1 Tax=Thielaviopsis punctulata TaxID=72032 RepID=A0A0F4Z7Q3_9PEZI|nr:hypothetical protein TD95_005069 [Thielaviopsis punctulata]